MRTVGSISGPAGGLVSAGRGMVIEASFCFPFAPDEAEGKAEGKAEAEELGERGGEGGGGGGELRSSVDPGA